MQFNGGVQSPIVSPAVEICVRGESYAGECMPARVGAHVSELRISSSSDNSATAGARTCRTYRHGSSLGLRESLWVESWVHPESYSELNQRAKRSLINGLLLSYTPTLTL